MSGPLYYDRVMETTTTTGTGTITLNGAVAGFQAFSAVVPTGSTVYYCIYAVDSNGNPNGVWECGLGTYTLSNTTLARTTVYSNSSGTLSALNLAVGTYRVILTPIAQSFINNFGSGVDGAGSFTDGATHNLSTTTGVNDTGYVLKNYTSLTITGSGTIVTAANRAQLMVILVQGNCTIGDGNGGTLHMNALGAAATPTQAIQFARYLANQWGERTNYAFTIPQLGANGGAAVVSSAVGNPGSAGASGQTGGGGSGGGDQGGTGHVGNGGAGAQGICFCGGSGGGGGGFTSTGQNGGAGASNGGAGGNGGTSTGAACAGGGAGNPVGTGSPGSGSVSAPTGGGGGTLILIVGGNLTIGSAGTLSANGGTGGGAVSSSSGSGNAQGGGGAGGGSIIVLYAGILSNSGTIQANGGAGGTATGGLSNRAGGTGGAGSIQGPTQITVQ